MFKDASETKIETIMGHFFYAKLLNNNSIIIDLGAHKGGFSSEISQIFKCQCYAVEPSPSISTFRRSTKVTPILCKNVSKVTASIGISSAIPERNACNLFILLAWEFFEIKKGIVPL